VSRSRSTVMRDHGDVSARAEVSFPGGGPGLQAAVAGSAQTRRMYHVDPTHIGVTGGSAGGPSPQFLGVTVGCEGVRREGNPGQSSAVNCVVNYYRSQRPHQVLWRERGCAEVLPLFLGGDLTTKRREHIVASPLIGSRRSPRRRCWCTARTTNTSHMSRRRGCMTS